MENDGLKSPLACTPPAGAVHHEITSAATQEPSQPQPLHTNDTARRSGAPQEQRSSHEGALATALGAHKRARERAQDRAPPAGAGKNKTNTTP